MPATRQSTSALAIFAVVLAVTLWTGAALAGKTASKPHGAAGPPAPLSLDPNASSLPASALGGDAGQLNSGESSEDKPDLKIPDRIKLGNQTLRFDTSRKVVDSIPRVGVEATDPAVFNKGTAADDDLPLKPDYFGLTLTVPTH